MKTVVLLMLSLLALPAEYIPPAEDVLLFRRDELALSEHRQILLAKDLLALATRKNALDNATQRRATAQLLALAANLDPSSPAPAHLNETFSNVDNDSFKKTQDPKEFLGSLSTTILYLLEEENIPSQKQVAELLLDPLAVVAPELDLVSLRAGGGESQRWQGVVAPLERFQSKAISLPEPQTSPEMDEDHPAENPTSGEGDDGKPGETVRPLGYYSASLTLPAFPKRRKNDEQESLRPQGTLTEIQLSSGNSQNLGELQVRFNATRESVAYQWETLKDLLLRDHSSEQLSRIHGSFNINDEFYAKEDVPGLLLPMAILGNGFLRGQQPLQNLFVLGEVTESGEVIAPQVPVPFLKVLLNADKSPRSRILLPEQLRPLLESLLLYQKEDFFLKHEVYLVKNLAEVYELAYLEPEVSEATTQFREIQQAGMRQQTSLFVANPNVLARLAALRTLEPRLVSAELLELRGRGKQPLAHSSEGLAFLIQAALLPVREFPYLDPHGLQEKKLDWAHEACRAELDILTRFVDRKDRDLYDRAVSLANTLRTLSRAMVRFKEKNRDSDDERSQKIFYGNFASLQSQFSAVLGEIHRILNLEPITPVPRFDVDE